VNFIRNHIYWHFLPKHIIERGRIFKAASHKSDDALRTFALERPPEGYRLVDTRLPREDSLDISGIVSFVDLSGAAAARPGTRRK
jgi:hypothetical protein